MRGGGGRRKLFLQGHTYTFTKQCPLFSGVSFYVYLSSSYCGLVCIEDMFMCTSFFKSCSLCNYG